MASVPKTDPETFAQSARSLARSYGVLTRTKSAEHLICSTKGVLKWVLVLASQIDIQSLPGNGWERLLQLQIDCMSVALMLQTPPVDMDAIQTECAQIIGEYYYLLELTNLRRATLMGRLCPSIQSRRFRKITQLLSTSGPD